MNFKDYINQREVKKSCQVEVLESDAEQIYPTGKPDEKAVVLKINHILYTYLLVPESRYLWTMDEDGNKKARSCFIFKSTELQQMEFYQDLR